MTGSGLGRNTWGRGGWRRRALAGAVGALALAAVIYPAILFATASVTSTAGCFIACGRREPGLGLVFAGIAGSGLALPVAAAVLVLGARPRAWSFVPLLAAGVTAVLLVVGWVS